MCKFLVQFSRSVVSDSLQPHGLAHQASLPMGFFQARVLEWIAISSFSRPSRPQIKPRFPALPLGNAATREAPPLPNLFVKEKSTAFEF